MKIIYNFEIPIIFLRIKNELYYWFYFKWARLFNPYSVNLYQYLLEHELSNEYQNRLSDERKINWFKYSLFDDLDKYKNGDMYYVCSERFPKMLAIPDNDGVENKEVNNFLTAISNWVHPKARKQNLQEIGREW